MKVLKEAWGRRGEEVLPMYREASLLDLSLDTTQEESKMRF